MLLHVLVAVEILASHVIRPSWTHELDAKQNKVYNITMHKRKSTSWALKPSTPKLSNDAQRVPFFCAFFQQTFQIISSMHPHPRMGLGANTSSESRKETDHFRSELAETSPGHGQTRFAPVGIHHPRCFGNQTKVTRVQEFEK